MPYSKYAGRNSSARYPAQAGQDNVGDCIALFISIIALLGVVLGVMVYLLAFI